MQPALSSRNDCIDRAMRVLFELQLTMGSFAQLRSLARTLETKTEDLLSQYSSFVSSISSSPTADEVKLLDEIDENLRTVRIIAVVC